MFKTMHLVDWFNNFTFFESIADFFFQPGKSENSLTLLFIFSVASVAEVTLTV